MDELAFRFLNNFAFQNEFLDTLILFCAIFFGWWLIAGLVIFLFYERKKNIKLLIAPPRRHLKELIVIFFTAFSTWGFAEFLKVFVFYSPRPYEVLEDVNVLFTNGLMDSFPSGHATFFFALAMGVYLYHKKLGILYFLGALLIGVARVTAGAHWPIDIAGGALLGILLAYGVYFFFMERHSRMQTQ